ncbi:hypothetical protein R3W88_013518 [Solanum pinnatisectum]|uniref:Cytochrome P450 n=1 Tax=Solanum pinnatisectum TaxID=50273 RepID=A0AAV9KNU7_9SOLN|nr:hypothetical protein R3W88_013518 [Solanum pinnatisectum]
MTIVSVYLVWFWLLVGKLKGPKTWPLVGEIHEWTTDQLLASPTLGTYQTWGVYIPFLQNWRRSFCTVTCHPKNLEHILHTKFHNYPKDPTWQNTFGDVLGNQVDIARKIVVPELTKLKLGPSLHRWVNPSIKDDLLPILDKASKHNISMSFGTDNIFGIALGKKLKILLNPEDPIALAMDTIFKFAFRRFFYPNFLWKFMRYFCIGSEGSLKKKTQEWMKDPLTYEEVNSLVYLHATLLETLRLYPAVPKVVRYAICDDIKRIGEDCLEFKPERWLSTDEKRIERHEDGYKFAAFNGGSRICIAKYLTYLEMKSAASAILLRYELSHVPGHQVTSKLSVTIAMNNGLKVNLKRHDLSDFDVIN